MTRQKDPVDVVATIKRSIETSPRQSRRMKVGSLRHLFHFGAWSEKHRELVQQLFADAEIVMTPSLDQAQPDDWLHFHLVQQSPVSTDSSGGPSPYFFDYLSGLALDTEKEVEIHFVSPLFHHLGYDDAQEAAGFRFDMFVGSEAQRREVDLLYFADKTHDTRSGRPLVVVECKAPTELPDTGLGQAQSYAFWIKPAYYVVTNGDILTAYLYQGGPVHDLKRTEVQRSELAESF